MAGQLSRYKKKNSFHLLICKSDFIELCSCALWLPVWSCIAVSSLLLFISLCWNQIEQVVKLTRSQSKHTQRITWTQTGITHQGLYVSDLWPWLSSVNTWASAWAGTVLAVAVDCTLCWRSHMHRLTVCLSRSREQKKRIIIDAMYINS